MFRLPARTLRLPLAGLLSAAALVAVATVVPATATAAPPQCLTNLVANALAGHATLLPAAPCSDADGDALTIMLVEGPAHGVLGAVFADGTRTYTAESSYVGRDVVRFKASDGTSESAASTLTITVYATTNPIAPPPAPQAPSQAAAVDPSRCVGRGARRAKNGLLATPVARKALRVFRADGSGARFITRLRRGRHVHLSPSFSPDGRQVVFEGGGASRSSIWRVNVASGRERRVTRSTVDGAPAWSPDGRLIAFGRGGLSAADRVRTPAGLWVVRPDGSGERLLARMSELAVGPSGPPSWSPNGRCLVFLAQDEQGQGLALVDRRGGGLRFIKRWDRRFQNVEYRPSWSRDGRQVAFTGVVSYSPPKTRLLRIEVDGRREALITPSTTATAPLFSPDGRTLVFTDRRGLYSMPAGGGRTRLIAPGRAAYTWGPRAR